MAIADFRFGHMRSPLENCERLLALALVCLCASFALPQKSNDQQTVDDSSRQIVLDRFNKARPVAEVTNALRRNRNRANALLRRPVYRRKGSSDTRTPSASSDDLGVTVWRLRPSRPADEGARVVVLSGLKRSELIPERIEADTPLNIGDRVRLSIESPKSGYLYVVDREAYADRSFGDAMLIFPTLRTRGGDNWVEPGKLIDIPAQEDQYPYFTAQPAGDRRDQVSEELTIILTPKSLNFKIGDQPLNVSRQEIADWEKLWGGAVERLELVGGAGQTWTKEEKEAGTTNGHRLTQTGPAPQTIYRVAARRAGAFLVTVRLRYAK